MKLSAEEIRAVLDEKIGQDDVIADHDHTGHYYKYVPTGERFASVTTRNSILDSPHLKKWSAGLAVDHIDKHWEEVSENGGVSSDLKKAALMAHEDVLQDAGGCGTAGHEIIERYLLSWMENDKQPEDITKFITGEDSRLYAIARSALQFIDDFEAVPIASEMFVVNQKDGYAGTLDVLMMITKITKNGKCNKHTWWTSTSGKMSCECGAKAKRVFALVDWKSSNSLSKPEYAMQASAYWYALWRMTGLRPEETIIVRLDKFQKKYEVVRVLDRVKAFNAFKQVAKVHDWLYSGESKTVPYTLKKQVFLD